MIWYVSVTADHHPEVSRIVLPAGVTVKEIYGEYLKTTPKEDHIALVYFYELWHSQMAHVSQQRVRHFSFSFSNSK